jgi:hypothetical protein
MVSKVKLSAAMPWTYLSLYREERHGFTLFLTSLLQESKWSAWCSVVWRLRKGPLMPTEWEAVWCPEPVWTFLGREKSLAHAVNHTQDCLSSCLVTTWTTPSWLLWHLVLLPEILHISGFQSLLLWVTYILLIVLIDLLIIFWPVVEQL